MHMRDSEVVASIVAGDPRGLAMAYDRYADPLYKYCRTLLRDPADAADAVQDTFVVAASRLAGLSDPERLRGWLYAVARGEALRIPRARQRGAAPAGAKAVPEDRAYQGSGMERADLRALFDDAAAGLDAVEREAIELQLRHGLETAEVAAVLCMSRNHAHTLLSRARDQLESCLGVLLVARAAREECGELGDLLAGWDGRLIAPLRKRLHRHIEHCASCDARRAFALSPAMLLDLSPGAALAAGAVESLRLSASAPEGLRAHTLAVTTGRGADAVAYRAAVLNRAGTFTRQGFPAASQGARRAGLAGQHRGPGWLHSAPRGQLVGVTAAVVAAVILATAIFSLSGGGGQATLASAPPSATTGQSATSGPGATAGNTPQDPSMTTQGMAAAPGAATGTGTATGAAPTASGDPSSTTAGAAPSTAPPPATSPPATPGSPSTTAATAPPPGSQSPPPSPAPPSPGTLSVSSPDGNTLRVVPGGPGATLSLLATGGPVTWSVTVANNPSGVISVTTSGPNPLPPGKPATVTISASQYIFCGQYSGIACPTVTVNPGGAVYAIRIHLGWSGAASTSHGASALAVAAHAVPGASSVPAPISVPGTLSAPGALSVPGAVPPAIPPQGPLSQGPPSPGPLSPGRLPGPEIQHADT